MFFKKILVLSPHTDDGELGAGGTIAKLIEQGSEVHYCAFCIAEDSVPSHLPRDILFHEVQQATAALGIQAKNLTIHRLPVRRLKDHRQEILDLMIKLRQCSFDLVLIPSLNDVHQDHQVIAEEAVRAFKNTTILSYELPWNNLVFNNTCFIGLTEKQLAQKLKALQAYKSQEHRDYMSEDFIRGVARMRGVQINTQLAEVFEVVRWIMR